MVCLGRGRVVVENTPFEFDLSLCLSRMGPCVVVHGFLF